MYSPVRHVGSIFHKGRPIHLTFFLTRRCNARCPFCFYLGKKERPAQDRPELSLDEIEKISRALGSLLWLAFSGGEIYLRNDLVEISKVFYRTNKPAIMLFPTNGMLPEVIREKTEQIVMHCRKSTIAVKLSLDGLHDAHDALRATPGSFEKTMQTYWLLAPLLGRYPNFELGINTVFCAENQDHMDEVIDYVGRLEHIRTHTISLVRGDLAREHYTRVDFEKYRRAIERLEHNLKCGSAKTYRFRGARLKAAQDILQRRLIHRTRQERQRLIPCYAGRLNLVLSESGEVFPCEMLDASLGNIREHNYDMQRLIGSEKSAKVIDSIRRNHCYCTHECYFMTNILFNPALYPALLKEYLRLQRVGQDQG
ncbi:MAG: radical SAM/SPASM domain-containing protein [Nitrospirota bacterium]